MDGFKKLPKMQCFKDGGSVANEKSKPSGDAVKMIKTPATGNKSAEAPAAATKRPNFRGSDVAKTNKLSSGDADKLKAVSPSTKELTVKSAAGKGDNTVRRFSAGKKVCK
jgi:hypothetical protein